MSTSSEHPIFARAWSFIGPRSMSRRERAELLEGLSGDVVEVGAGDGLNFAFYPPGVASLLAVEPEPTLRTRALRRATPATRGVDGTAEDLPAADGSADAAVACPVLCSVTDQARAPAELHRVLRPGGELRFYEHVRAHGRAGLALQRGLDRSGVWPCLAAGCHLTRDTAGAIAAAGFEIERCRSFGVGLVPVPHITGVARRR